MPCLAYIMYGTYKISGPEQRDRYSDTLRTGRYGVRIPVEASSSSTFQTGHGAHPASCTGLLYPGLRRPRRGVDQPPHLAPRLKKEQSSISAIPLSFMACYSVVFTVPYLTNRVRPSGNRRSVSQINFWQKLWKMQAHQSEHKLLLQYEGQCMEL